MSKGRVLAAIVITVAVCSTAGCGMRQRLAGGTAALGATPGAQVSVGMGATAEALQHERSVAKAAVSGAGKKYLGVYERGVPQSYSLVESFASRIGRWPNIALYYSSWGEKFWLTFAATAHAHGALPFVQLQPNDVSLAAIAAGRYDTYLRGYANAVRIFGYPVILSFGHEMNGSWYTWGSGHTSPAVFRLAWRHVVSVFRAQHASNVIWMWTVNSVNAASSQLGSWWPGSNWVNWVGIDGYYYQSADTFYTVFGTTLAVIREFSSAPVLISETGSGPGPAQVTQINGLFRGVRGDHLLGLLWFDQTQHAGFFHQDWRLEDSVSALTAFRHDVGIYLK